MTGAVTHPISVQVTGKVITFSDGDVLDLKTWFLAAGTATHFSHNNKWVNVVAFGDDVIGSVNVQVHGPSWFDVKRMIDLMYNRNQGMLREQWANVVNDLELSNGWALELEYSEGLRLALTIHLNYARQKPDEMFSPCELELLQYDNAKKLDVGYATSDLLTAINRMEVLDAWLRERLLEVIAT